MFKARKVILLIAPSRAFDRGLLQGIARYANEYGPWTFYREPPHYQSIDWKKKVSDRLYSRQVDGIIMREPERIDEIIRQKIPGVCAPITQHTIEGFINITVDNDQIGELGAEHLMGCGFQHFAYCGLGGIYWSVKRGEAFCRCVQKSGRDCHIYQPPADHGIQALWEKEEPYLVQWLKSLPKPVGILTCNDDRSQHVLDACHAGQIHVPSEIAIVGVDNDEFICELANPPLSSISLNPESLGYRAAQLLDEVMAGRKCPRSPLVGFPTHVVTRRSTDILLVEDPEVSRAIRFIRDNVDRPLQVADVAEAVAVSRRTLQQKFSKTIGSSVHSMIVRERVNRITHMLVETSLTVAQIAERLSFSSPKQLDRVFTKLHGIPPTVYRGQHCG